MSSTTMQVERRFPLVLHKADDDIRALYETAKRAHWNPDTDLPWAANALDALDPQRRGPRRGASGAAAPGSNTPG